MPAPTASPPTDPDTCTACRDATTQIATEEAAARDLEEELHRPREKAHPTTPATATTGWGRQNQSTSGHPNSFGMHDWEENPDPYRYETPQDRIIDPFRHHPDNATGFAERRAATDARIDELRRAYQRSQNPNHRTEENLSDDVSTPPSDTTAPPPDDAPPPEHPTSPDNDAPPTQPWRSSLHASRSTIEAITAANADSGSLQDGPPPF